MYVYKIAYAVCRTTRYLRISSEIYCARYFCMLDRSRKSNLREIAIGETRWTVDKAFRYSFYVKGSYLIIHMNDGYVTRDKTRVRLYIFSVAWPMIKAGDHRR